MIQHRQDEPSRSACEMLVINEDIGYKSLSNRSDPPPPPDDQCWPRTVPLPTKLSVQEGSAIT